MAIWRKFLSRLKRCSKISNSLWMAFIILDNGQFHIWIWKVICIMHWNRVLSFKFQVASLSHQKVQFSIPEKKEYNFVDSVKQAKKLSYSAFYWKAIHFTSFYGSLWSCQDSTDLLCHETKKGKSLVSLIS